MMKAAVLASMVLAAMAIPDGNPHKWGRLRRCDDDYGTPGSDDPSAKCGLCEGIGGIATADDQDAITYTSCVPLMNASDVDPANISNPDFPLSFTADLFEVLISEKSTHFPGPNSSGPHSFQPEQGTVSYDFKGDLMRFDYNVGAKNKLEKNQSETIWQHANQMFIVIKKEIAGQDFCVCPKPTVGVIIPDAMSTKNPTYPSVYLGRERIGVEFLWEERVVDHFIKGPHHAWIDVATNRLIRGWQPWNGLDVYDNWRALEPNQFDNLPPKACTSGIFRVDCGNITHKATDADKRRARNAVPRPQFKGNSFSDMSDKLNKHLENEIPMQDCDQFSLSDLNDISHLMNAAKDPALDDIYSDLDDKRKLEHSNYHELDARFQADLAAADQYPHLHEMIRDGKCHEIVMWYVHHLSSNGKKEIQQLLSLPRLPTKMHAETGAHASFGLYQRQINCFDCHLNDP